MAKRRTTSENWEAQSGPWPDDARLRKAGYTICRRQKGKEAVWLEPGSRKEVGQAAALKAIEQVEREIDQALKQAG